MRTIRNAVLLLALPALMTIFLAANSSTNDSDKPHKDQKIQGLVRDIACPLQNKNSTSRVFNRDCALQCARRGSPLAVLTDDGTMYLPISDSMPDTDQRAKLMPFVGKYVSVKGDVYERKGLRAIVIKEIKEDPTVKVKADAF